MINNIHNKFIVKYPNKKCSKIILNSTKNLLTHIKMLKFLLYFAYTYYKDI